MVVKLGEIDPVVLTKEWGKMDKRLKAALAELQTLRLVNAKLREAFNFLLSEADDAHTAAAREMLEGSDDE